MILLGTSSDQATGQGLQEVNRGSRNGGVRKETRKDHLQGLTVILKTLRAAKGGQTDRGRVGRNGHAVWGFRV